jgi:hypothetical protein
MSNRASLTDANDLLDNESWRLGTQVIPYELAHDSRLSLDARALALWLAFCPPGQPILLSGLPKAVGVGRDAIRRMLKELGECRYLLRTCERGAGGRWIWKNRFSVVPYPEHFSERPTKTVASKPVDGESADGSTVDRRTDGGSSGDRVVVVLPSTNTNTTTTTTTTALRAHTHDAPSPNREWNRDGELGPEVQIDLRGVFVGVEAEQALAMLAKCPFNARQDVIDDIAGKRLRDRLRGPPLNLLYTLIQTASKGSFSTADAIAFRTDLNRKAVERAEKAKHDIERQRKPTEEERQRNNRAREEAMAKLEQLRKRPALVSIRTRSA